MMHMPNQKINSPQKEGEFFIVGTGFKPVPTFVMGTGLLYKKASQ
jgi:hypothetical protein